MSEPMEQNCRAPTNQRRRRNNGRPLSYWRSGNKPGPTSWRIKKSGMMTRLVRMRCTTLDTTSRGMTTADGRRSGAETFCRVGIARNRDTVRAHTVRDDTGAVAGGGRRSTGAGPIGYSFYSADLRLHA